MAGMPLRLTEMVCLLSVPVFSRSVPRCKADLLPPAAALCFLARRTSAAAPQHPTNPNRHRDPLPLGCCPGVFVEVFSSIKLQMSPGTRSIPQICSACCSYELGRLIKCICMTYGLVLRKPLGAVLDKQESLGLSGQCDCPVLCPVYKQPGWADPERFCLYPWCAGFK